MREKVIKLKIMSKNKRHSDLKMSSVETRTAHSQTVGCDYLNPSFVNSVNGNGKDMMNKNICTFVY